MSTKYTKEILEKAVEENLSIAGVCRALNLKLAGGTQSHIKKMIIKYEIDISHFTGQGWNKNKVAPNRKTAEDILVVLQDGSRRPQHKLLKRAMLEYGIIYQCSKCFNNGTWLGKPITLEVDHIDGDFLNNLIDNLRFVCPNCHSQFETNKPWKTSRGSPTAGGTSFRN